MALPATIKDVVDIPLKPALYRAVDNQGGAMFGRVVGEQLALASVPLVKEDLTILYEEEERPPPHK